MNGKDTSDEDEEDILVSNTEAALSIETLQRYLQDCKSDASSMKIGKVKLFLKASKLKSYKQIATKNRFLKSNIKEQLPYLWDFFNKPYFNISQMLVSFVG